MYFDLIVLVIIILGIIFFCRKFRNFVYLIAVVDIFLRILTFIKNNLGIPEISSIIAKYLPENLPALINKYTNGVLAELIIWAYVIIMIFFLCYTVKILWKRK